MSKEYRWLRRAIVTIILSALFYFALRNAPLVEIWSALKQLEFWQIILILSMDAIIYALITARWWIIIRAEKKAIEYLPLIGVRVSVFGISYFTLGPQVGGEPLQVLYLQRAHRMTLTRATSTVVMDKLLEFLANFALLAVGLTAIFQAGIISINGIKPIVSLIGLVILILWIPLHIILLYRGFHPVTSILGVFPKNKLIRFIGASEWLAGTFCRRHISALLAAIFVSLLAGSLAVIEFALIVSFLQIKLSAWQIVAAWTAGGLAFLVPLPGGLGALEASMVFAMGTFGIPAASAIGVTLLMRGRDILIGGLGLFLAGRGLEGKEKSNRLV